MPATIGILDQSPVVSGASASDAIAATVALARRADELGYARYWLAEHHAMPGLADASPEVLLGRLTAETSRIRLGTGGIMLPHYSAFKVAETFRMLEALAPGRIDLGLGRAPGGTSTVSAALESRDAREFPQQVADTVDYLDRAEPPRDAIAALTAMPSGPSSPAVWILGSSEYGAGLAAEFGLPYAYAHFIGDDAPGITAAYRARFRASARCPQPRVALALAAIAAPTTHEAEALALPLALWRMRVLRGIAGPFPSLAEAHAYPFTPRERDEIARTRRVVVGDPLAVKTRIDDLAAAHGADDVLVVTIAPDYASRTRSYELLAEAFALPGTGALRAAASRPASAAVAVL